MVLVRGWDQDLKFPFFTIDGYLVGRGKIQATAANSGIEKVSELIDYSTKTWNMDLIRNLFTPMEVQAISCIPLSIYASDDKMVWYADNSGMYTVRSGYRNLVDLIIDNNFTNDHSEFYKQIWKLNIPPKIKITIWRFTYDFIPTATNLYNRRINVSPVCASCGEANENFMHTLLLCGPAKDVWRSIGVDLSMINEDRDFRTWLKAIFKNKGHHFGEITATTAWVLWKARNKRIIEDGKMIPIWIPPQDPFVKVNFNVTFKENLHQSWLVLLLETIGVWLWAAEQSSTISFLILLQQKPLLAFKRWILQTKWVLIMFKWKEIPDL